MKTDGIYVIKWAVGKCVETGLPPTDANILMYIRLWTGE